MKICTSMRYQPICLIWSILALSLSLQGQVSSGGTPPSFQLEGLAKEVPMHNMPSFDLAPLLAEDELYYSKKGQPIRFGHEMNVDLSLENFGQWEELSNGDRLWRAAIHSKGAKSINLTYSHYELPQGARFYLYNQNYSSHLGAFTSYNNKVHKEFSTGLINGSITYLEYFEPADVAGKGKIEIAKVIHAYKYFSDVAFTKDFGDSGNCNNNVNCPGFEDWTNEINSAAMIIENGFRTCSGAMINNSSNDCTPYFLTANHCGISGVNTWLLVFNYQSPNCTNIDGPLDQSVSGVSLNATWGESDFTLCQVSVPIPPEYNVYLAGYNALDEAASLTVGIHHPSNDIKKISFNTEGGVFSSSWSGGPANTHWEVSEWEDGTTEGGSSGSPLYDQDHRVIGQLTGGSASCQSVSFDAYGKMARNWEGGGSASNRVRDYLDPLNTGALVIDGRYCNASEFDLDATLGVLSGLVAQTCATTVQPTISISNQGNEVINTMEISIQLDNGTAEIIQWNGALEYLIAETIDLGNISPGAGQHSLQISIISVNGISDENPDNNSTSIDFELISGTDLEIEISTDDWGDETSISLVSATSGTIILEAADFPDNSTTELVTCVSDDCYLFTVNDSWGDGLNNNSNNTNDDGEFIVSAAGVEYVNDGGVFGDCEAGGNQADPCSATYEFCITSDPNQIIAQFDQTVSTICEGETVSFSDQSIGAITNWSWDFGAAGTSQEQNPSVTFNAAGTYSISLEVSNSEFSNSTIMANALVVEAAPTIDFQWTNAGLALELSSVSTNGNGYTWDFGDNIMGVGTTQSHLYAEAGEYTVCLTVVDGPCDATECKDISVDCLMGELELTTTIQAEGISFSSTYTGDEIESVSWNFGDGNSSDLANPVHLYAESGDYNVCVNIVDSCGNEVDECSLLNVVISGLEDWAINGVTFGPNPTSGPVAIRFPQQGNYAVRIIGVNGQVWNNYTVENAESLQLDLSQLAAGMYYLEVSDGKSASLSKLIRL